MKKGLFVLSLISLLGVMNVAPRSFNVVKASDEVALTDFDVKHGKEGSEYEVLVGEVVELLNSEFTFTPVDASNQNIIYSIDGSSYSGTLPSAMFSDESSVENIMIKGLKTGDFTFYITPLGNEALKKAVIFHCVSELTNAERPGLSVIETQEDNNITPGAKSVYESPEVENQTPLFQDGKFMFSSIVTFISSFITVRFFIIMGAVIVGLAFLYILIYNIKKAVFKDRR